jgi:outer membrane protein assembly factor BamD
MKIFYKLLILIIFFQVLSCSKNKKEISLIKENNQELEMVETYKEAIDNLEKRQYFIASQKFLESELLFPQSDWAPKSALMASYSYYLLDYYAEAIFNLERFIQTYPLDSRIVYAYYLLAVSHYEIIEDEKKDLKPLIDSKKYFELIIAKYPDTDFAFDSKFKLNLINEVLASKEMYIGKHYLKKKKWIAAINRFKIIISDYDTTIYVEEAIHRLVEVHYHIGLLDESKKYAKLLGYNYLSSKWYEKSYKILNKDYARKEIINDKKKNIIYKKFKKLFD